MDTANVLSFVLSLVALTFSFLQWYRYQFDSDGAQKIQNDIILEERARGPVAELIDQLHEYLSDIEDLRRGRNGMTADQILSIGGRLSRRIGTVTDRVSRVLHPNSDPWILIDGEAVVVQLGRIDLALHEKATSPSTNCSKRLEDLFAAVNEVADSLKDALRTL